MNAADLLIKEDLNKVNNLLGNRFGLTNGEDGQSSFNQFLAGYYSYWLSRLVLHFGSIC